MSLKTQNTNLNGGISRGVASQQEALLLVDTISDKCDIFWEKLGLAMEVFYKTLVFSTYVLITV